MSIFCKSQEIVSVNKIVALVIVLKNNDFAVI